VSSQIITIYIPVAKGENGNEKGGELNGELSDSPGLL
jgi:hypothetical protein